MAAAAMPRGIARRVRRKTTVIPATSSKVRPSWTVCRAARKSQRGGTSYDSDRGYSGGGGGGYSGGGGGGYGGGGYSRAPREMFSAICSECGQTAQVPFQPRTDKPVYCSSCFEQ